MAVAAGGAGATSTNSCGYTQTGGTGGGSAIDGTAGTRTQGNYSGTAGAKGIGGNGTTAGAPSGYGGGGGTYGGGGYGCNGIQANSSGGGAGSNGAAGAFLQYGEMGATTWSGNTTIPSSAGIGGATTDYGGSAGLAITT